MSQISIFAENSNCMKRTRVSQHRSSWNRKLFALLVNLWPSHLVEKLPFPLYHALKQNSRPFLKKLCPHCVFTKKIWISRAFFFHRLIIKLVREVQKLLCSYLRHCSALFPFLLLTYVCNNSIQLVTFNRIKWSNVCILKSAGWYYFFVFLSLKPRTCYSFLSYNHMLIIEILVARSENLGAHSN